MEDNQLPLKNKIKYHIVKEEREHEGNTPLPLKYFLSPNKKRWLIDNQTKHKFGEFTIEQCDFFIKNRKASLDYIYYKELID